MTANLVELKVPSVGESVSEVEIANWLIKEGDAVRQDENVLVLETDKATLEVPSPVTGRLVKVLRQKGERVRVGEVLGQIEIGPGLNAAAPLAKAVLPGGAGEAPFVGGAEAPALASNPLAVGSGVPPLDNRSTQRSEAPQKANKDSSPIESVDVSKSQTPLELLSPDLTATAPDPREEVVPMSLLRRKTAERLVAAQHAAALLTTFNEIDMTAVMAFREDNQERFLARYQIKLGYMSFFVKATVTALQEIPQLNAQIRAKNIVYHKFQDIGVAIGGGRGLVVPVLRDAGRLSFAEIEQGIADFARRVKENQVKPEELAGGTFTITNGGIYGSLLSTPLVNPPQSGILGMHAIQERPVAVKGEIVIRPMMYVALSYDHRLVDGREAVQFLKRIKELLESPVRLLIEV